MPAPLDPLLDAALVRTVALAFRSAREHALALDPDAVLVVVLAIPDASTSDSLAHIITAHQSGAAAVAALLRTAADQQADPPDLSALN